MKDDKREREDRRQKEKTRWERRTLLSCALISVLIHDRFIVTCSLIDLYLHLSSFRYSLPLPLPPCALHTPLFFDYSPFPGLCITPSTHYPSCPSSTPYPYPSPLHPPHLNPASPWLSHSHMLTDLCLDQNRDLWNLDLETHQRERKGGTSSERREEGFQRRRSGFRERKIGIAMLTQSILLKKSIDSPLKTQHSLPSFPSAPPSSQLTPHLFIPHFSTSSFQSSRTRSSELLSE